jgi:dipeptidyl aminopeptidase/acylaminoacyl peptidase
MKKKAALFVLSLTTFLDGCTIAPKHHALSASALPDLIPVRAFVADIKSNGDYKISPDGKRLAWRGVDGVVPAVMVKTLGTDETKAFRILPRNFQWTGDSARLIFLADKGGDEATHLYAGNADGSSTTLTDLTPFDGTLTITVEVVEKSAEVVVMQNRRDKKVFDLYKIDTANGRHTLLATNPGNVPHWGVDRHGVLRARIAQSGDERTVQVKQAGPDDDWKSIATLSLSEQVRPIEFTEDGMAAWVLSNRGRDKTALVKLDLGNGAETVVYEDPVVDIDDALVSRQTRLPLAAYSMPDYPKLEVFDARLRDRLTAIAGGMPAGILIHSRDDDERNMTLTVVTDRGTRSFLYQSETNKLLLLGEDSLSRLERQLGQTRPVRFTSRDDETLHGYLTLPAIDKPEKLPMVLLVHGGPWRRDQWGGRHGVIPQFLANRGYAVLQVNFRGSVGYGRAFTEKAIGEFAGKMHDDLIDGVNWAVSSGIADPARIGIYGGSYGGYAALLGVTFTPEVFACAVDLVGPSDLARTLETAPPYWELGKPMWKRYVGDPANPEDRKRMDEKSPLYKAEAATKPVLIMHGVNDPRVKLEQSELMVSALKKAGKQVEFVTFSGDGHGNQRWPNNLALFRKTEDFFAACLGGRSSGFDFYQLGSWAF